MSKTKELLQKGADGAPDIYVDPTALRQVSSDFAKRLTPFFDRAKAFEKGTPHQDGEFGKLTFLDETRHVNDSYVKLQKDAVGSLGAAYELMGMIAEALSHAADQYDRADGVGG